MAAIGERSVLSVARETPLGLVLDGEELGEVLLPRRDIPPGTRVGEALEVMVRPDVIGRLVASAQLPRACVGEFACLRVVGFNPRVGAYLDWGNGEELLLPVVEAGRRVVVGTSMIVGVILDSRTGQIVATNRLDRHLSRLPPPYVEGQRVRLLITAESPLGYKAIVENAHWGLVYRTAVGSPLEIGAELDGYVRGVRPDGKIDLALDPSGYGRVAPLSDRILEALKAHDGRLEFSDRSTPAEIREAFGTSKKAFKQAVGALYRQRRVRLEGDWIELVDDAPPAKPRATPPPKRPTPRSR